VIKEFLAGWLDSRGSAIVQIVSVEKTLRRVDADLAEGNTAKARERLSSLVGAFPERLDVREYLARVCRLEGDSVQAGRWSYLAEERIESEVSSFEHATRNPVNRMRALQWPLSPGQAATAVAHDRLEALLEQARTKTGDRHLRYDTVVILLLLFLIGVVDGVVTVFSWLR
jgi:hypothetical protein